MAQKQLEQINKNLGKEDSNTLPEKEILHELIVRERNKKLFPMSEEDNKVFYKYRLLIYEAMNQFHNFKMSKKLENG